MSYKEKLCAPVSGMSNEDIWREIRALVGGTTVDTPDAIARMNQEIVDYNIWVAQNGVVPFDRWLRWLIRIGTTRYNNLATTKVNEGKVGHGYAPCPYSLQSGEVRTRLMLGLTDSDPLPVRTNHIDSGITYFLSTTSKGSRWGQGCTFIGCPYYILNGSQFFYV